MTTRTVFRLGVLMAVCMLGILDCAAQVRVGMSLQRSTFLAYEPIIARVTIENLSGRDLDLADTATAHWFGFEITTPRGRLVAPRNRDYSLPGIRIPAGQSITRGINLTPLYPLSEYGTYSIQANIYVEAAGRYFSSAPTRIQVTEGRTLWEEKVGVADQDLKSVRQISLIQFKLPKSLSLYLRIEDPDEGLVYCTHQLGRAVNLGTPDVMLDTQNAVHILHHAAPQTYLYNHVNLDGRLLDRRIYKTQKRAHASLVKAEDGTIQVVGGEYIDPNAPKPEKPPASVTDRPVPLPTPPAATAR